MMSQKTETIEKNRKNHEQKFTATKEKIDERRKRVYTLDLQGFSNKEIAKDLGVSLSTIEKDLKYMRFYCLKWSKDMIRTECAKPLLDSINEIDIIQKELWKMYREENDKNNKRKILESIASNSSKKGNISSKEHYFSKYGNEQIESFENNLDLN